MSAQSVDHPSGRNQALLDPSWKGLCTVAGIAALLATVLFVVDVVVLTTADPIPESAQDWFTLFRASRPAALLQLFFTDLFGIALLTPIGLALFAVLRRTNEAYAALAALLAFLGIATIFATNPNYTLLHLGGELGSQPLQVEASQLVAAGEAAYAAGISGTGTLMAGLVLEVSLLMFSVIMLRSHSFGRGTAYLGIAAHGLDLTHAVLFLLLIPLLGEDAALAIGTPFLAVGGTLQLIWYPLIGSKLIRLGRMPTTAPSDRT
jgi:hypothetical protein